MAGAPVSQGQGQGAAQVFQFPEISRGLEFERQVQMEEFRNNNIEKRRLNIQREKELDAMLVNANDDNYWRTNPTIAKDIETRQKDLINKITELAPRLKEGDVEAQREVRLATGELEAAAARSVEWQNKWNGAAELYKLDKSKWSNEAFETMRGIGTGELSPDEVAAENPYWFVPDLGPSGSEYIQGFIKNESSNFLGGDFTDTENIGGGLQNVTQKYNVDDAAAAYEEMITANPAATMNIIKDVFDKKVRTGEVEEGKELEYHFRQMRSVLENMNAPSELRNTPTASSGGRGSGAPAEQDYSRAVEVKQNVADAISTGNGRLLDDLVSSAGYTTYYEPSDDTWVFTDEKGLQDGSKAGTVTRIPRSNEEQIYQFIAKVNPNYPIEAIEAGKDPERDRGTGKYFEELKAAPEFAKDLVIKTKSNWANNENAIQLVRSEYEKLGFEVEVDENNAVTGFFGAKPEIVKVFKDGKTYSLSKPDQVQALEEVVTAAKRESIKPESIAPNKTKFKGVPEGGF